MRGCGAAARLVLAAVLAAGIRPAAAGAAPPAVQDGPADRRTPAAQNGPAGRGAPAAQQDGPADGRTPAAQNGPAGRGAPAAQQDGPARPETFAARYGPAQSRTPPAPAAPRERGAELRVWLVTAGPGDAVWEHYGHNALRVLNTRTGRDVSYNWGFFDFRQADFIARFLRGRMLYMVAELPTGVMLDQFREADREVVLQELDLTPAEKAALRSAAHENALPHNRDFIYQYFLDNCSTRVRDLLDRVLGGALREAFEGHATGVGYRHHTRRLTRVAPFVHTGTDLLLGSPADRPIPAWDELFLPLSLRDRVRSVRIARDGDARPLVLAEEVLHPSRRPPAPAEPPAWLGRYLALGLLAGALFASAGKRPGPDVDPAAPERARPRRRMVARGRRGRDPPGADAGDGPHVHVVEREPLPLQPPVAGRRRPAAAVDRAAGPGGAAPAPPPPPPRGAGAGGPALAARAGLDPAQRGVPRPRPAAAPRHRVEPARPGGRRPRPARPASRARRSRPSCRPRPAGRRQRGRTAAATSSRAAVTATHSGGRSPCRDSAAVTAGGRGRRSGASSWRGRSRP